MGLARRGSSMNSDTNKEIDLLLRRHGRRKATTASAASDPSAGSAGEASAGPHMDADEMNAYAEGQMPGAARARALVHLADCDECRAIVTNLTLVASAPIEIEQQSAQKIESPGTSWRKWLAALFAPPVIRYATAAVVLLCMVGVAFLVLRQQKSARREEEPELVARNNQSAGESGPAVKPGMAEQQQQSANQALPPAPQASPVAPGNESSQLKDSKAGPTGAPAGTAAGTGQANQSQPSEIVKSDEPAAPLSASRSAPETVARDQQRDEDRAAAAGTTPAAQPATAAPAVAGVREEQALEADKTKQRRKDGTTSEYRLGGASTTGNTASGTARESEDETVALNKPAPPAAATRRRAERRPEAKAEGAGRSRGSVALGETSAETRSVGGRQFRREGGAWVDTAYTAGRATVNVSRGSEQYRALVADEPGLRAIAEQLGGEVIVVWKGRAYRIL